MTKARDIASAAPAPSTVSATEIGYLDGVTSAIQTQIDGKQAANANVSTTELGYLDGVTSAIQTQLDGKTAKSTLTTTGDIYYASSANTPARLGIGSTGQVLTVASGIPSWAAAASGGMTLLASGSLAASGIGFDLTSISGSYNELWLYVNNWSTNFGSLHTMSGRINNDTTTSYNCTILSNTPTLSKRENDTFQYLSDNNDVDSIGRTFVIKYPSYANTTSYKLYQWQIMYNPTISYVGWGIWENTAAINRLRFDTGGAGSFDNGTYELYGVK